MYIKQATIDPPAKRHRIMLRWWVDSGPETVCWLCHTIFYLLRCFIPRYSRDMATAPGQARAGTARYSRRRHRHCKRRGKFTAPLS